MTATPTTPFCKTCGAGNPRSCVCDIAAGVRCVFMRPESGTQCPETATGTRTLNGLGLPACAHHEHVGGFVRRTAVIALLDGTTTQEG